MFKLKWSGYLLVYTIFTAIVSAQAPSIIAAVNSASFQPDLCPGVLATVYCTNFGSDTRGVVVQVGAKAATVITVLDTQINIQIPTDSPTGATTLVVDRQGQRSPALNIVLSSYAPGLFTKTGTANGPGLFFTEDMKPVSDNNPAIVGKVVVGYATGLGAANVPSFVTIGGVAALVVSVGPAAGLVGTYQVSFQIPPTSFAGTQTVVLGIGGKASNAVTLTVSYAPRLAASPTSLSFAFQIGGATPTAKTVALTASSGSVPLTVSVASGAVWLSANISSNTSPATLTASVKPAGLAAGTYYQSITVTATGAFNSPLTIPVTLDVTQAVIQASAVALMFTATQSGPAPPSQTVRISNGGGGTLAWTALVSRSDYGNWLVVTPSTGTAPSVLTVAPTTAEMPAGTYQANLQITAPGASNSPVNIAVTLNLAASPQINLAGIGNVANYVAGKVAPGEIIVVYGSDFGPATMAQLQYVNGVATTSLGNTRIYFDNVAAPVIYVASGVLSCVVPYSVAGKTSTQVQVEYNSVKGNTLTVPVVDSVPGIFSLNQSGAGPGAILNWPDYTVNGASNRVAAGGYIMAYATGEGNTDIAIDGQKVPLTGPYPKPLLGPWTATVGGKPAPVTYYGSAPDNIAGLFQVNVQIPPDLTAGIYDLVIKAGSFTSQSGLTVAVK